MELSLTKKQEYYRSILDLSIITLRSLTHAIEHASFLNRFLPSYRKMLKKAYDLSEAIHNIPKSVLEPEYVLNDICLMNNHFKVYWDIYKNDKNDFMGYYIFKIFEDIPKELRKELEWEGPEAHEINWFPMD